MECTAERNPAILVKEEKAHKVRPDEKTRFKPGHKTNVKFNEVSALFILEKMYVILATDHYTNEIPENPVRANNIKLQKELCLATGITCRRFEYFKEKFTHESVRNKRTGRIEFNDNYSPEIVDLVDKIEAICECRLVYSGTRMDMILLKTHYCPINYNKTIPSCYRRSEPINPDILILSLSPDEIRAMGIS